MPHEHGRPLLRRPVAGGLATSVLHLATITPEDVSHSVCHAPSSPSTGSQRVGLRSVHAHVLLCRVVGQALPRRGYTRIFENMLLDNPMITIRLNVDFFQAREAGLLPKCAAAPATRAERPFSLLLRHPPLLCSLLMAPFRPLRSTAQARDAGVHRPDRLVLCAVGDAQGQPARRTQPLTAAVTHETPLLGDSCQLSALSRRSSSTARCASRRSGSRNRRTASSRRPWCLPTACHQSTRDPHCHDLIPRPTHTLPGRTLRCRLAAAVPTFAQPPLPPACALSTFRS